MPVGIRVDTTDPFGLKGCDRDHPNECSLSDVFHNFLSGLSALGRLDLADKGPGWKTGFALSEIGIAFAGQTPVGRGASAGLGQAAGDGEGLSTSAQRGIRSLTKRIEEHMQKLQEYRANPDAYDNQGLLKGANPEVRERIINGRIRHLQGEIDNFRGQIRNLQNPGGA